MKYRNDNQLNRIIVYIILDIATILTYAFFQIHILILLFALLVFTYLLARAIYYYIKTSLVIKDKIYISYNEKSSFFFSKISKYEIEFNEIKAINKQIVTNKAIVALVIKLEDESYIIKNMFSERQMDKIIQYCQQIKIIKSK